MTPKERYERKVRAIHLSVENDEQAKDMMREEAARLNLTLDEMLQPAKARQLIDERESPVLEGLMRYFANKEQDPQ